MPRLERDGLQNEQIERALNEIGWFAQFFSLLLLKFVSVQGSAVYMQPTTPRLSTIYA